KRVKELSAFQVRRIKRPGLHAVGGVTGLYLQVKPPNRRSWILRATIGDRRRDIGLGAYPDVTLEQARERAREARDQIYRGIDPVAARKAAQDALRAAEAKRLTFDEAAVKCWRARSQEFKNPKHAKQWLSTLELYASPIIGKLPVGDVELAHVVRVLEPIWTTKTETASRLRGRIETVLEWARVAGYRDGQDNPAAWRTLQHVLPAPGKLKRKNGSAHFAALPWQQIPDFMRDLRGRAGIAARALEFAILTAARSGEVRLATWDEIDLDAKLWTVPSERMKAGLTHRVPLSAPAVALLKALPRHEGSPYVFAAPRGGALSDMALSALCRRMGYLDPTCNRPVTPHGFRSSFKDWARSSTAYPDEVSELALAHVNDDKTRAAYARDELLPKRARLMREWAKFCFSPPRRASVTPIRRSS
ncbi:MAG TPA: integrase arm-type DNA-binding domain-containing protein, partial [Gammaproteobacteria bacterium]